MTRRMVVFGLSLSSSWGNGHAATFRGLLRALAERGWSITFFERDVEWYRSNSDLPEPGFCDLRFYDNFSSAQLDIAMAVDAADAVMVGSFVPDGAAIIDWLARRNGLLLFYDIDTPITLERFARGGETEYLRPSQVQRFKAYFSFAGGPALDELEVVWGARHAEALYCGVDTTVYRPVPAQQRFACALSYLGTYAADRQPAVEELLFAPARALASERFFLGGAQYPAMDVPRNVTHEIHVFQRDHAALYCSSRATLNLTRQSMRRYGWAPSTRLFEAAACGACIISDTWQGLDSIFEPDNEVLLAETRHDVLRHLGALSPERRSAVGDAARARVLRDHTYERRAEQVELALDAVCPA